MLSVFYKLCRLYTKIKITALSNVCAWVFQRQLHKTTTQLKNRSLLTLLLFLPAWKRPDDNNVEYWSPSERYWPLLLNHLPPPPWSLKGLHMFMAHACGMTMGSPYKSQRDHGVFQILLSEDSCWQNDSSHIYFGQKAGALSGKLIRHPFSPKPHNKKGNVPRAEKS